MTNVSHKLSKELYAALRRLSRAELWPREAREFDRAPASERLARVAVIRAVGAAFAGDGSPQEKADVRAWLRGLLRDPQEKVRRYAMAALPKLGAGQVEEEQLLSLLSSTETERERQFVAQALDKIGSAATLRSIAGVENVRLRQTEQKVKARLERADAHSVLKMENVLPRLDALVIHLHTRKGLERIVREEVQHLPGNRTFRVVGMEPGLVAMQPLIAFSLNDVYGMRCFGTAGIVLGSTNERDPGKATAALATIIASSRTEHILETLTAGALRYRLALSGHGHQRALVRALANRVYALNPRMLNDPHGAPWTISVISTTAGQLVEACPKLVPDPRFRYRREDVPAASHPPLAACLARLAGPREHEVVWDPFCGSGVELIERALLGGVDRMYGTDLSAAALDAARANVAAAQLSRVEMQFHCCDFRQFERLPGIGRGSITLMMTNPPLGKRVPVPDLRRLMQDIFSVAARLLCVGGRLVLINPVRVEKPHPSLQLQYREVVDVGILEGRLEKYVKVRGG